MTAGIGQPKSKLGNGPFPLAPMTTADVLDGSFDLIRSKFRPLLVLSLLLALPMAIATFVLNYLFSAQGGAVTGSIIDGFTAGSLAAGLSVTAVSLIISIVFSPLIMGAITRVVAGSFLGREFEGGAALKSMVPFWITLIVASLLAQLALIPGFLAFGVGALVVAALFWVTIPVIAIEEVGPIEALKRSWRLMSARLLPYIGLVLVIGVVSQALSWIVSYLPTIVAYFWSDQVLLASAMQGLAIVTSTIAVTPFMAVVATLVYFDARVRVEGFDIRVMASQLPEPTNSTGPAES